MTFNSEGNGADASSLPNYKVIRVGDVAFEGHSNKSFAYGRFVVNAVADGIMSPRFSCLRPKNSYPVRFWKYYIHSEQVMREILVRATKSGTMMNELVIDDLFKQSIAVPQEAEQQAIGYFFSHLDTLITLHQRKYDKLVVFKKSMLEKMFPKDGESVPEIRFAGFTDPWEQRKLGEIADKVTEKNLDGNITEVLTNSAEYGVINQTEFFDHAVAKESNIAGYYVIAPGDFVYNPRISATAPVGPIRRNTLGIHGVMSPLYTVFRLTDAVDGTYLSHFFKTNGWHGFMKLEGNSGARSDRFSIGDATFFEMPIPVPSSSEQHAIGSFFSRLDDLITLHQRKRLSIRQRSPVWS